jgi:hypothetical protein
MATTYTYQEMYDQPFLTYIKALTTASSIYI